MSYLNACGLEAEDVPQVIAVFAAAKPVTLFAFAIGGIRYKPLTRLFARTYRPAREKIRSRFWHELERTRSFDSIYSRQLRGFQRKQLAMEAWYENVRTQALQRAKQQAAKARASRKSGILGMYDKAAEWYRIKSKVYADTVAANSMWANLSAWLAQDPRRLALGVAEGIILYKALFWVHGPVELFLIARYFKYRRANSFAVEELTELKNLGTIPGSSIEIAAAG